MAFKEWAIIVDALGQGDQIVILRKGGISEGPGGFRADFPRFLLFPTLFHQQGEMVVPEAAQKFEKSRLSTREQVVIQYLAEVQACHRLDSAESAQRLQGQHIWNDQVIAERVKFGREKGIFALAVRVSKLREAVPLPMRPEYGGCKSWVDLGQEIDTIGSVPVLKDPAFQARLNRFKAALTGTAAPAQPG